MEEAQLRDRLLADEPGIDLDALLARTRQRVEAERGAAARIRQLSTPIRTGLVLAAAVGVAALALLVAPRPDLAEVSPVLLGLVCAGMLGGALAGVWLAMRPTWRPEVRGPARLLALTAALAAPAIFLWVPVVDPAHALRLAPQSVVPATIGCFLFGTIGTFLVGATWRLVEHRSQVGSLHWATAAAAAAAVGNLALVLHCPMAHVGHQLVGHVSLGLVWAGIAALVARLR